MTIICPTCDTRYDVDPAMFAGGQRKAKCIQCGTKWVPEPIDPAKIAAPASLEAVSAEQSSDDAGFASEAGDGFDWNSFQESPSDSATPIETGAAFIDDAGLDNIIARSGAKNPVSGLASAPFGARARLRTKSRSKAEKIQSYAVLALAACVVLFLFGRTTIVRIAPQFAPIYASIGMPVSLTGLEFAGIQSSRRAESGRALLEIRGMVVNIDGSSRPIPPISLAVLDKRGIELYRWTARADAAVADRGGRVPFRAVLSSPPRDAHRIELRFVEAGSSATTVQ